MTKGTRKYIYMIIGITLICLISGLLVRRSIVDIDINDVLAKGDKYQISNEIFLEQEDYKSNDEIYDEADLIVKGKLTGKRKVLDGVVLSEISVEDLYKGQCDKLIYVYEDFTIVGKDSGYIVVKNGYLPMIENKEYLLFLDKSNITEEFKFMEGQNSSYKIVDNLLGRFPMDIDENSFVINELPSDDINYYNEVAGKEQVFKDENMLNFYMERRNEALNEVLKE
ncbi:hypothetical protein FHH43_00585 [Clostridium perfringens]|nr:hypothetical protein [Clostridium perfringens]